MKIQRIIVKAKPSKLNKDFEEWETASICVFIAESNEDLAIERAVAEIQRRKWEVIRFELTSSLIKERVQEAGSDVWAAYQEAERTGLSFGVFPDNFGAGRGGIPTIRPPRISEKFIDTVVSDIGGQKLDEDGTNKTADYLIEDWLFELKDLQEEGLEQKNRQTKLVKLFEPYFPSGDRIRISPEILTHEDQLKYFDIIGSPIQPQVKKASAQIKNTKANLKLNNAKAGLIYLNTGYGSLPHEMFEKCVERYARKDSRQFETIICISTWTLSNGFESMMYYAFYPPDSRIHVVEKLRVAFGKRFGEAMTQLITGNLPPCQEMGSPLKPVVFNAEGFDAYWEPPVLPKSWIKGNKSS
jgi:hypothetical protein